jgi:hypothetical protein
MRARLMYEQTATVTCTDNGKSSTAEVISFNEGRMLVVSLERSIKLEMVYNPRNNFYTTNKTGLEFVSKGPKKIELRTATRG